MTTIAYRDGILAADQNSLCGNTRTQPVCKLIKRDGWVLAGCGDQAKILTAIRAFDPNAEAADFNIKIPDEHSEVVAISANRILMFQHGGWLDRDPDIYHAWGSGMDFAYGALDMNATAVQAVEIAIARDVNSGGGIDHFDIRAALKVAAE